MEEPAPPRAQRGKSLDEATREDLDVYAVDELAERIARLENEIARTRKVLDRKRSGRSAADALFSFGQ
ncbi:DUF1192 domain-containing protein [Caulobacter sp. S45]|jgi:uncharacterized small protein (DUF1192 family)|uniref:DUF1192 domain-containing protein n=1 Tax=Caulobacter sp. S45 TaxID=1641861 RepID=UPI00131BAD43|nr:DUF1192 domain-containing protein [Caulobacter sp. S45]